MKKMFLVVLVALVGANLGFAYGIDYHMCTQIAATYCQIDNDCKSIECTQNCRKVAENSCFVPGPECEADCKANFKTYKYQDNMQCVQHRCGNGWLNEFPGR